MPLTEVQIKQYKPQSKTKKLYDEKGLYLEVAPSGGKWWRLKYRFDGKEKRVSLGVYPDVGLKEARTRRDDAKRLLVNGIDPSEHKKQQKQEYIAEHVNTFETVAREWYHKNLDSWTQSYSDRTKRRLERDVFPWIGKTPVANVTAPDLLAVARRIDDRGARETAHRILNICSQIFRYAVANGLADRDITTDLKGAIPPSRGIHFAAVTEPQRIGEILRMFDDYRGSLVVRCALKLAPLVFVRPGELRQAKWSDIDFDNAQWSYLVTKTQTQHIVPLSTQAIGILKEIHPLTGNEMYVFPSQRSNKRPMSDNAILAALRRMGIPKDEMSGHGFRAMARTILDEVLHVRPDYIEHQLAHAVRDPNGRAYNRTKHLDERRKMMQLWADYLDWLKVGGEVIPFKVGS
jgi:integrase